MSRKITAIRKYRPEIRREPTIQMPQVVEDIAQHTGLNEGEIRFVVYELRDTILTAHRQGRAVKIEGLGTFTPTVRMDGNLDILFRPDAGMLRQLNNATKFHAKIMNKSNIGKSAAELIAKWNTEFPDDPVEG
ncbi:MAG: hypothetical protein HND47_14450 [Chloroflexi bacterium]|nr:hypothetical protein [Chloroflexota bacterium]